VGLVALALAEQIGTAILAPQAAWAMMVALVVSLDPGGALNGAGGGETVAGEKPRLEPATGSRPQQEAAEPEKIHGKAPGRPPPSGPTVRDAASGPPPAAGAGGVDRPLGRPGRFLLMLAAMGLVFGYARGLLVPFAQEGRLLREAAALLDASSAAPVIRAAAEVQPLAWEPAYFEAYLWHQAAQGTEGPGAALALERAVRAYREALARHPRLRRAYLAMAECLLATPGAGRGRLAEARAALEQAARLYPTHLPTRLRLARVIDRLGRRREALEAYREVLRLDALARPQGRGLSAEERAEVAARVAALEAAGDGNRGAAARPAAPQTGWTRTARTW